MLLKPYAKIFLPALMFVIGAVGLTELVNHSRHHGDEVLMTLFWVEFNTKSAVPYIVLVLLTAVGFWFSRLFAREVKEAWGDATFVEGQGR